MSATQLVLIPSYNTGPRLGQTVAAALDAWQPVWLVVDGSDDGSDNLAEVPGLRIIRRVSNGGKGAAVFTGLVEAAATGFTHVLVMDADGQHPADEIAAFMEISLKNPAAMVLGLPVFDGSAPLVRVLGRRISNVLTRWETGRNIGDALFGFRVYPVAELLAVMQASTHMRRYDFDTEAVVRLCWQNVQVINRPAAVRYFSSSQGGVSHFHYIRDNISLAAMHARLVTAMLFRPFLRLSK